MTSSPAIIPTDSPSIFEILKSLTDLQRRAIVRPDNPPPGIAGFLFDIPEEEEINIRSEISDHFLENNTAITDQIALKPIEFSVRGLVAELVAVKPRPDVIARVANPLVENPAISPELTPQAQQQQDEVDAEEAGTDAAVDRSSSLWGYYLDQAPQPPSQTRQARALGYFMQLQEARQLFTIETPYGFLTNMAILSLRGAQSATTKGESAFSVVFKKVRFAGISTVTAGQLAGRANLQMAPVTNNGTAGQTPLTTPQQQSLLFRLTQGP